MPTSKAKEIMFNFTQKQLKGYDFIFPKFLQLYKYKYAYLSPTTIFCQDQSQSNTLSLLSCWYLNVLTLSSETNFSGQTLLHTNINTHFVIDHKLNTFHKIMFQKTENFAFADYTTNIKNMNPDSDGTATVGHLYF